MSEWIEIFMGGTQKDSVGRTHDGDAMIDRALSHFKAGEAPLVFGHPEDNAPAYGWVSDLRKAARGGMNFLEAKFDQVPDAVRDLVREGRYRHRSASFRRDGSLRHVGLLGAVAPAVKGLAPLKFEEDPDLATFEFREPHPIDRLLSRIRAWLTDIDVPDDMDRLKQDTGPDDSPAFTESREVVMDPKQDEQTKQEIADLKAKLAAEQAARQAAEANFSEAQTRRKRQENETWTDQQVQAGALLAGEKAGVVNFLEALDQDPAEFEFSEGKKAAPATWFKEFIEARGKHALFKEFTPAEGDTREGGISAADMAGKV